MRKASFPTRQCIALFHWPFPKAVSTRDRRRDYFLWGNHSPSEKCSWVLCLSFSSLMVSCPSSESAQGLLIVTRSFGQVSKYFTVMFNKFSQLIVSKQFLAEIFFLTGKNTRHLLIVDLLVSDGASSLWLSWHEILTTLPIP